jgi:di/tricarboxylate transporter
MSHVPFTTEMALVLAVLLAAVVLFVSERVRIDVAAVLVMVALGLSGLVGAEALFRGFASNAVISIIAVMILGSGLDKAGAMRSVARFILRRVGTNERRVNVLVGASVGVISGFMQNIGAAALFVPVVTRIASHTRLPVSRLMMPMGFAAILGGTLTLVGSGPLILLNDLMATSSQQLAAGELRPFGLFDVTPVGLALLATGIVYFALLGRRVLPAVAHHEPAADTLRYVRETYGVRGDLFEATVTPQGSAVGARIEHLEAAGDVFVLAIRDAAQLRVAPGRDVVLAGGQIVALIGRASAVRAFCERFGLTAPRAGLEVFADVLAPSEAGIMEAVVRPGAEIVGKRVRDVAPRQTYGVSIVAINRGPRLLREQLRDEPFEAGDILIAYARWRDLRRLETSGNVVVLGSYPREQPRTERLPHALGCFALALGLVVFTDLQLSLALMTGAIGMVLLGVLRMDEAYRAVSWQTVFLLAGLLPLGLAVEQTGTAAWLAQRALGPFETIAALPLILVLATLATLFSLVMSNVGATVLLVPIAINLAVAAHVDPRLAALTVALATSNAFLIPTHQVNALIMGPGGYAVRDFLRAGGVMTVLFLVVLTAVLVWGY